MVNCCFTMARINISLPQWHDITLASLHPIWVEGLAMVQRLETTHPNGLFFSSFSGMAKV